MRANTECRRAYNRGYYAGSKGWYPKSAPPLPPEPVVADLINALNDLCNAVDGMLATFDTDDDIAQALDCPLMVGFGALTNYKSWLRATELQGENETPTVNGSPEGI